MQYSVKYRPTSFSEVIGQDVSVRILRNSILMDRIPNSVLFSGLHGTGKTTLARLFAKALNCDAFKDVGEVCNTCVSCVEATKGSNPSIMELDAASNNGVDDVRQLEELLRYDNFYRYKVVIFDECHMLSNQAQSALLKSLEEPSGKMVYLLVTTDRAKIQDPIVSRCLTMPLRNMSQKDIAKNITGILQSEGYTYTEEFIQSLATQGRGSLRDVQQLLEQVSLSAENRHLTEELINEYLGLISYTQYKELASAQMVRDIPNWLKLIDKWYEGGCDLVQLFEVGVSNLLRDFMLNLSGSYSEGVEYLTGLKHDELTNNLLKTSTSFREIHYCLSIWEDLLEVMLTTTYPRSVWSAYAARTAHANVECKGEMPQVW